MHSLTIRLSITEQNNNQKPAYSFINECTGFSPMGIFPLVLGSFYEFMKREK